MGWKQAIAYTIFSRRFIDELKEEPQLFFKRVLCFLPTNLQCIFRVRRQEAIRLNIGSGSHTVNQWVNVDLNSPVQGFRWDLRWNFPLRDASVVQIHCEHFLEHLEYPEESLKFLKECQRVLISGGELRIIVPDVAKYIGAYTRSDRQFWEKLSDLGNSSRKFETEIEIINQCFRMGGDHRFAYDAKTLGRLLTSAGFTDISRQEYSPNIFIDQGDEWRRVESLYMTALKPGVSLIRKAG